MHPIILQFHPFERAHAEEMLSWQYAPPYDIYNSHQSPTDEIIQTFLLPELHYFAVLDEQDRMIAFRCFGIDAQVPGGDYSQEALDMGGGLRPDLIGQGLGRHLIAAAMNYALGKFSPLFFRTTVASFNIRARKVCERIGYSPLSGFARSSDGLHFDVLLMKARAMTLTIPLSEPPPNKQLEATLQAGQGGGGNSAALRASPLTFGKKE